MNRKTHTTRRSVLALGVGAVLAAAVPRSGTALAAPPRPGAAENAATEGLRALEREHSARLGVFALNTVTGRTVLHRAGERFPMCSVFKTIAAAAVLRDLDRDGKHLARRVRYTEEDVARSGYAPVTGRPGNLANGMAVSALCEAAVTHSDNAAANLLLRELGGPGAVTRFCRSVGDRTTRLDRWEPELNSAEPWRVTDTTSPAAIGRTYALLLLGDALAAGDRKLLTSWLLANTLGNDRLRAGLPADWTAAEKTGSGEYGTANDVGVVWTPDRVPVVLAALSTKPDDAEAESDDPLLAKTAALVADTLA